MNLEDELIVASNQLEWHQKSSIEHQEFKFFFGPTDANLPYNFHFGSFINECIKQIVHATNWFKRQYKMKKD